MKKFTIKVSATMYGTAYYTVCAEDEDHAKELYHEGNAEYQETDWGDTEEDDIYEVEEEDCGGCEDCDDEEDDEEQDPCPTCRFRVEDEDGEVDWGAKCSKGREQAEDEPCDYYQEGDPPDELAFIEEEDQQEEKQTNG